MNSDSPRPPRGAVRQEAEEPVRVRDKLHFNSYLVDDKGHLAIIDTDVCRHCEHKGCLYVCPVEDFVAVDDHVVLSWEGCVECGSCRIICDYDNIRWEYPAGGRGICYRYG